MRLRTALVVSAVAVPSFLAAGTVVLPHTFSNNTIADANAVNANFSAVKAAVDDTASKLEALQPGGNFYAPGSVVQTKSLQLTANLTGAVNNAFSANLATLSVTPKFANSKFIVSLSSVISLGNTGSDPHLAGYVRLVQGSTTIATRGAFLGNTDLTHELPIHVEGEFQASSTSPITIGIQLQQRTHTSAFLSHTPDQYGPGYLLVQEVAQ